MPVFALIDAPVFPRPDLAEPSGLLAVGGDLRQERLLAAYRQGIFPWYDDESPILWWSPDPRPLVELPDGLQVTRRLERTIRSGRFRVSLDTDFSGVIRGCAGVRRESGDGTWLVPDMIAAYEALHAAGHAHSAEAWLDGELVGGAYGVAVGRAFFGESMFHRVTDASKVAFVVLARFLERQEFQFIDCQQATGHLRRFGAVEISRSAFMRRLRAARECPDLPGPWRLG